MSNTAILCGLATGISSSTTVYSNTTPFQSLLYLSTFTTLCQNYYKDPYFQIAAVIPPTIKAAAYQFESKSAQNLINKVETYAQHVFNGVITGGISFSVNLFSLRHFKHPKGPLFSFLAAVNTIFIGEALLPIREIKRLSIYDMIEKVSAYCTLLMSVSKVSDVEHNLN